MPILFRLALLLDLGAIWCETAFPALHLFWPFSVDHGTRLMLLMLAAIIPLELSSLARIYRVCKCEERQKKGE